MHFPRNILIVAALLEHSDGLLKRMQGRFDRFFGFIFDKSSKIVIINSTYLQNIVCLFHLFLLLRESDGGAVFWTNPQWSFTRKFSGFFFNFSPVNLLLIRSHQAEIIVKCLIQGRNNATRMGAELKSRNCDHTVAVINLFGHAADISWSCQLYSKVFLPSQVIHRVLNATLAFYVIVRDYFSENVLHVEPYFYSLSGHRQ